MAFREFSFVRGSKSFIIAEIQEALNRRRPHDAGIAVDGVLGPITQAHMRDATGDSKQTVFTAADFPAFGLELVNVVDLSGHNEGGRKGLVNFDKLKAAGCGHVIPKLSEGATYFNDECVRQFAEAARVGMTTDAYHFLRSDIGPNKKPVTNFDDLAAAAADAELEAAWTVRCLQRAGNPKIGVLYGDLEKGVTSKTKPVQAERYNGRHTATWLTRINRIGAPYLHLVAGIYSALWAEPLYFDDADKADLAVMAEAPFFGASYNAGITPKRLPDLYPRPRIWQYEGRGGRVDGVTGDCDLGVMVRTLQPK